MAFDVRQIWDFDSPAESEAKFRNLLQKGQLDRSEELEVLAQIARTFSLRRDCERCHQELDPYWDEAMEAGGRPKACFELERGRAFRSSGDPQSAKPFFELAAHSEVEDLKIDALHMLAIIESPSESTRINLEALRLSESSTEMFASRWQGTLCNNLGWTEFDAGNFAKASDWFARTVSEREKYGQVNSIRIAKWCLARSWRAEGKLAEALEMQRELVANGAKGYAQEEIAEILTIQGKSQDAKPYFRQAADFLESELGAESERIQRMRRLS